MMRYERKVSLLAGSLVALLAIWGLGMIFSPERSAARAESRKLLSGKIEDVAAIELGKPALSLAQEGGSWYLVEGANKLPAKESRVKSFLESVSSLKRLRPMAKTKEAWKSLSLDEGSAKPVLARDGKGATVADFAVGGYGPTGDEVYLRLAGSEESFAVDSALSSYIGSERRSWLDLRVVPGAPAEANVQSLSIRASIALDGAGKPPLSFDYAIAREKDGWKGLPGTADPVAIESLLRSIIAMEGEDIVAQPPAGAFSPVSARIEFSLGNGSSVVLETGAEAGDGRYYLRQAESGRVYTISTYALRNALKGPADLLAKK